MDFGENGYAPDRPPPGYDAQAVAGWPVSLVDAWEAYLWNAHNKGFTPMGSDQFRAEFGGSVSSPSPMQQAGQVASSVGGAAASTAAGNAAMSALGSGSAAAGAPSVPVVVNGAAAGGASLGMQALPIAYGALTTGAALNNLEKGRPNEAALWTLASGKPLPIAAAVYGLSALRGQQSHPETQDRRRAIDAWQERGFIDDNENMQLGNGNSLYFADPRDPRTYNVDQDRLKTDRGFADLVGFLDPIAALMSANSGKEYNNPDSTKLRTDMTGMLANALQGAKGGSPIENAISLAQTLGLDRNTLYNGVSNLHAQGQIDTGTMDAWHAAIDLGYNVRNPNASQEDNARFDAFQQSRGLTPGGGVSGQAAQVTPWWGGSSQAQTPPAPQSPQMPSPPQRPPTQGPQGLKTAGLNYNPVSMSQSLFPAPLQQAEAAKPKPPVNIGSNLQQTLANAGIQTAPLPQRQGVNIPTSLPEGIRATIYQLMQARQQ